MKVFRGILARSSGGGQSGLGVGQEVVLFPMDNPFSHVKSEAIEAMSGLL